MKHREIGGFFTWTEQHGEFENEYLSSNATEVLQSTDVLCLSGRTALDLILEDIKLADSSKKLRVAYVPSYACESMLEPLVRHGYTLRSYQVYVTRDGNLDCDIDLSFDCDLFLATTYFGYGSTSMDAFIDAFSKRGVVSVEDITHRFFNSPQFCESADYSFASIRKWLGVASGGLARGLRHITASDLRAPGEVQRFASESMHLKAIYLSRSGGTADLKKQFRELNARAEGSLQHRYVRMSIDQRSKKIVTALRTDGLKFRRRTNAIRLIRELAELDLSIGLATSIDIGVDCPLFVPIFIEPDRRDDLAASLRESQVYSPVHWPEPSMFSYDAIYSNSESSPYLTELSLPCDQRYDEDDMARIGEIIKGWV